MVVQSASPSAILSACCPKYVYLRRANNSPEFGDILHNSSQATFMESIWGLPAHTTTESHVNWSALRGGRQLHRTTAKSLL